MALAAAQANNMTAQIAVKECSMGIVSAQHWTKSFMVIKNGMFRVYLSEHSATATPDDFLFETPLDTDFKASPWKRKEYSEVSNSKKDFYCFYLQKKGMLGMTKILKIGLEDIDLVERIMRCIEANTHNPTTKLK